jgi:hypothetical protein
VAGDGVFDFGGCRVLVVEDVTNISTLADDLFVI